MYAILFDLDSLVLQRNGQDWRHAESEIHKLLVQQGFRRQRVGFYEGRASLDGKAIDAVKCILTVQALANAYPWFAEGVRDIRMLRIEEDSDLRPAIDALRSHREGQANKEQFRGVA